MTVAGLGALVVVVVLSIPGSGEKRCVAGLGVLVVVVVDVDMDTSNTAGSKSAVVSHCTDVSSTAISVSGSGDAVAGPDVMNAVPSFRTRKGRSLEVGLTIVDGAE